VIILTKVKVRTLAVAALVVICVSAPAAALSQPYPGAVIRSEVVEEPELRAYAAALMEAETGALLYGKEALRRRAPASLTKIMTAIVAIERGILDDEVRIPARAAYIHGSSMHLRPGDVFTLRDLLWGLLMVSGNDAALAIAIHVGGGSEAEFVKMMNEKAFEIGAYQTRFANPHGLTAPNHYSTAYDLALITRYALQYELFREIVGTTQREVTGRDRRGNKRTILLNNTNKLLHAYPGADGVKTGTTAAAGRCLVASARRGGLRLIAVVLHAADRWYEARRLLDYGFENFTRRRVLSRGEVLRELPVRGGMAGKVQVGAAADLDIVMPRDASAPLVAVRSPEALRAPVRRGQKVGSIVVSYQGVLLRRVDLVALDDVAEVTLPRVIRRMLEVLWDPPPFPSRRCRNFPEKWRSLLSAVPEEVEGWDTTPGFATRMWTGYSRPCFS